MSFPQKKLVIFVFLLIVLIGVCRLYADNSDPIIPSESARKHYIIMLDKNIDKANMDEFEVSLKGLGVVILKTYRTVMKGWAVDMPEVFVSSLLEDKRVVSVEPDQTGKIYWFLRRFIAS
ncbi:14265_t:CDS:2 [Acaulospora morrowiae]|uniref:14265_t:CDS:1 n=1 Tax=Acaulospora morrowiae TaxID=94023 RepID=A0A9N8YT25_9GLOM|nr:14265_t:CDS:2 [Acaulospora morrowiae]